MKEFLKEVKDGLSSDLKYMRFGLYVGSVLLGALGLVVGVSSVAAAIAGTGAVGSALLGAASLGMMAVGCVSAERLLKAQQQPGLKKSPSAISYRPVETGKPFSAKSIGPKFRTALQKPAVATPQVNAAKLNEPKI